MHLPLIVVRLGSNICRGRAMQTTERSKLSISYQNGLYIPSSIIQSTPLNNWKCSIILLKNCNGPNIPSCGFHRNNQMWNFSTVEIICGSIFETKDNSRVHGAKGKPKANVIHIITLGVYLDIFPIKHHGFENGIFLIIVYP